MLGLSDKMRSDVSAGRAFLTDEVRCKSWAGHSDLGSDISVEDLLKGMPTTSMENGWLYRTSCDEKNEEIAPFD